MLEMVGRAQERGHLKAGWVAADDAFGMSPSFREGLAALGMWYVLDVPSGFTVWPPEPAWTNANQTYLCTFTLIVVHIDSVWRLDCPRSLAGPKPLAWVRATPIRRIAVLHDMLVYVIRFTNPLLHR